VPAPLRQLGRVIGWFAVGLSFVFIGMQVSRTLEWDLVLDRLQPFALAVAIGVLIYGLAGLLLAEAWRQLLSAEPTAHPARLYHAVYGRTQIAKYLPGNVFHFAGRQWLGRDLGHTQTNLALASVAETVLLIAVASALALPLVANHVGLSLVANDLGKLTAAVLLGLALVGAPLLRGRLGPALRLSRAALLYSVFFLLTGGVLWLLILSLGGGRDASGPWIGLSALALAWITGLVTPGAAAGLGVREAVLIMVLDDQLGPEASLAVALALRLVTTCGDAIFFATALILHPQLPSPATAGRQLD
jgi:hypothetical protein